MPTPTQYAVIDAPGHHGDWIKVYSVHRTLAAARRAIGGSALFVVTDDAAGLAKGHRMHRTRNLHIVED